MYKLIILFLILYIKTGYSQCDISISASLGYDPGANNLSFLQSEIGYKSASGKYSIYPAFGNNIGSLEGVKKPFIVASGYDPQKSFDCGTIYTLFNRNGFANYLRSTGYDIIILTYDNSTDYIQRNAFLVMELLNQLNNKRSSNDEAVVVGISMGGLIVRYALSYMEANNIAQPLSF